MFAASGDLADTAIESDDRDGRPSTRRRPVTELAELVVTPAADRARCCQDTREPVTGGNGDDPPRQTHHVDRGGARGGRPIAEGARRAVAPARDTVLGRDHTGVVARGDLATDWRLAVRDRRRGVAPMRSASPA